jgi:hypothetical protein
MKTLILTLTLFFSFQLSVISQTLPENKLYTGSSSGDKNRLLISDKIEKSVTLDQLVPTSKIKLELEKSGNKLNELSMQTPKKKKKSVGLGVLLSALLPGAGEFYGESYLKAGIFFGVELLAWGTYIYFTKKGDNRTEDYQAYADQYWDYRVYAQWLRDEQFDFADNIEPNAPREVLWEQIRECERHNFSHTIPDYQSQQYYELIGKYQNFQAGWTNLAHRPTRLQGPYWFETYKDPVFTNYAISRQDANDMYEYAKIGPVTAIVNHILSAADAAWTISTYNSKIKVETGFRMDNRRSPYTYKIEQIPTFNLSVNF